MTTPAPHPPEFANAPMVFGYGFAADGAATPLEWSDVLSGRLSEFARYWLHLNRLSPDVRTWLKTQSGLDHLSTEALLQEDTRPRAVRHDPGFLINLRGMNLNEGEALEDMLALRMWASETALITLRAKPIRGARDVETLVKEGKAPASTGGLIAALADALTDRMEPEVAPSAWRYMYPLPLSTPTLPSWPGWRLSRICFRPSHRCAWATRSTCTSR